MGPLRAAGVLAVEVVVLVGVPSAPSFSDVGLTLGGEPVLDQIDRATGSGGVIVVLQHASARVARGT